MSTAFSAGFSRIDITPPFGGVPLAGYGATRFRLSGQVMDRLHLNIVAVGTDGKAEGLLMTADFLDMKNPLFSELRSAAAEAVGLDPGHVYIGCTHTHSAPDLLTSDLPSILTYKKDCLPKWFAEGALRAAADLKPAKIFYGKTEVGHESARFNFNRYYYMVAREKLDSYTEADLHPVGANFGTVYSSDPEHYAYVRHEEEADHEMMIIKFARENADDIVLLNFAAHASITGGSKVFKMSSDYPGALRARVEELCPGTKCTFLQGCAGNTNTDSRIASEGIPGLTYGPGRSHYAYAAVLAAYAKKLLDKGLTESESSVLAFAKRIHTGKRDHSMDHLVPEAEKVAAVFREEGHTDRVRQMVREAGFSSPYHCTAAIRKAAQPETESFEVNAVRFGDVAMTTGPFELFSGTGKHIKAASPFKMTLVKAYSCDCYSYLPSINSQPNSYEAIQGAFVRGTAEELEPVYQEMLEELYQL